MYMELQPRWKQSEKSDHFLGKIEGESSLRSYTCHVVMAVERYKYSNGRNAKTYDRKENVSSYMRTNPVYQMTTHVQ